MGKWIAREIIMTVIDYKSAGVDIHAGNETVKRIKKAVESTFSSHVLTDIGSFGAMYDLKSILQDYEHPVLVQSIDGVGTKTIVARMMNKFDTLGIDLVSATANDIIVLGAKPLTLLDYIANDKLRPEVVEQLVFGMVKACRENGIALVGGETAEMPGTYLPGEHDLAGVITGVVEKDRAILGKDIVPGDVVLAFASSGLHTNGYSLARKLLFDIGKLSVESYVPELQRMLGEALLEPHINYTRPVLHLLKQQVVIKGMAHITGGGLLENIPRILPQGCSVEIKKSAWPSQPLFSLLAQLGELDETECYRTFNMGIGLILIGDPSIADTTYAELNPEFKLYPIGQVVKGDQKVLLCE
ncbi:MAG: purM [Gammaproteobacteria bacterium]|nr:purM [Gammaproteobacteria bacterium]